MKLTQTQKRDLSDLKQFMRRQVQTANRNVPQMCPVEMCLEEFVLKHGQAFEPMPCPAAYRKGTQRNCFRNAFLLVRRWPTVLRYVEGFAMSSEFGGAMYHAWAIDYESRVVDVTWLPEGRAYFGVVLDLDYVRRITRDGRSKTHSVIDRPFDKEFSPILTGEHTDWMP